MLSWRAVYSDGTVLAESPGVSTDALDRERLTLFEVLGPSGQTVVTVPFTQGDARSLVWRRRSTVNPLTGALLAVEYLVGWVGPCGSALMRISGNGDVALTDRLDDVILTSPEVR